jgi:hypothetical protein
MKPNLSFLQFGIELVKHAQLHGIGPDDLVHQIVMTTEPCSDETGLLHFTIARGHGLPLSEFVSDLCNFAERVGDVPVCHTVEMTVRDATSIHTRLEGADPDTLSDLALVLVPSTGTTH